MKFFLTGIFFSLFLANSFTQTLKPKGSFQALVGLPINLSNPSFKGIMQGLVVGSFAYQHTLKNSLSFGIGANYSYFTINEFKVPIKTFGGMHSPALYVKVGQEKFHSTSFGTEFALKVGYARHYMVTDLNRQKGIGARMVESMYWEPTASIILVGDEETAFKFTGSYMIYGFGFQPDYLGFSSNIGYDPSKFSKLTTSLSFGFTYVHYFRMR